MRQPVIEYDFENVNTLAIRGSSGARLAGVVPGPARSDQALERVEVGLEAIGHRAGIENAASTDPREHESSVGPAGVGKQHLVAGFEHSAEHGRERAHPARSARNAIGRDPDAVHALELRDQLLAQREQALRVRVERLVLVDGALAGVAYVLWVGEVGLPEVESNRTGGADRLVGDLTNP